MFEIDIPAELQDHSQEQGTWVWSLRSGVMRWSARMYQIFGTDPTAFDTTIENYSRMVHPTDRKRVQSALLQGIRQGSVGPLTYRITREDGQARLVEAVICAEYDLEGVVSRVFGVLKDVTDRTTQGALAGPPAAPHKLTTSTQMLIDEWQALGRDLADRRGLAFESVIATDLPPSLPYDDGLVTQIILQLLNNACQFTARGTVTLALNVRGSAFEISVADTGVGIPPHATMLALRGQRLHTHASGPDDDSSSGSGLPMVRSYVERFGGSLMVASTMGVGSKFTVTLPLYSES